MNDVPTKKIKHLELIQGVINRMAGNMFLFKGWGITLVAASLALLSSKDVEPALTLTMLVPVAAFWILDGYFLSQEKCFRALYKEVAEKDEDKIDFLMDNSRFNKGDNTCIRSICSPTLCLFYGMTVVMILIVFCWKSSSASDKPLYQYQNFNSYYRSMPHDPMFRSWERIYIR